MKTINPKPIGNKKIPQTGNIRSVPERRVPRPHLPPARLSAPQQPPGPRGSLLPRPVHRQHRGFPRYDRGDERGRADAHGVQRDKLQAVRRRWTRQEV